MEIVRRRKNYIEKVRKYFDYLVHEYGYVLKGIEQAEWSDKVTYENASTDRMVILSNQYHPVDYGFEIQWYRPSVSTSHADREFQIYVLKENQDDEQEYLLVSAEKLKKQYEGIIRGENWISTKA